MIKNRKMTVKVSAIAQVGSNFKASFEKVGKQVNWEQFADKPRRLISESDNYQFKLKYSIKCG